MDYNDSSFLYREMVSHLNYLYEGKVMYYLSPYGGTTAIKVKEVIADPRLTKRVADVKSGRADAGDMAFKNIRFRVLSENNNVYDMDDLYAVYGSELHNEVIRKSHTELW